MIFVESALLVLLVLVVVILALYPLFLILSIAGLLRKYLKCKIRESQWQLFLFEQQNKADYRFDEE